jgi:hypothetical protein
MIDIFTSVITSDLTEQLHAATQNGGHIEYGKSILSAPSFMQISYTVGLIDDENNY